MLTRCPSCGTTFRLRPEQLGQAQGRVRCGKCNSAFSAVEHRIDFEATDEPVAPTVPEHNNLPPLPASIAQFSAAGQRKRFVAKPDIESGEPAQLDEESNDLNFVPDSPADRPAQNEAGPTERNNVGVTSETPPLGNSNMEPERGVEAHPIALPIQGGTDTNPIDAACGDDEEPADDVGVAEPEAMADLANDADSDEVQAQPRATSEYLAGIPPVRRWPWVAGTALLGVALLLQVLFAYRTELAKNHPGWRPALEAACGNVCTVELPRDADRVSIESSELNPESDKKRLQLVALLKNRAPYPQSYPHLELTLTDVRDQALVRRVFAPSEYLEKEAAPSFGPNAEVSVKLTLEIADVSAAGYRVYLFYP